MLEIGDGTYIAAELDPEDGEFSGEARTRVRAGGAVGGRAWVARITGTDPVHGMARDFLTRDASELSGTGRSGAYRWDITGPGLYQYGRFAVSSVTQRWGYVVITRRAEARAVMAREARQLAAQLDAARHRAGQLFDERVGGSWDWDRTRRGARDALRAATGGLAVGDPSWQFEVTADSWAVYGALAEVCRQIARDAREAAPDIAEILQAGQAATQ